jgi:hypothetical protein
MRAIDAIGARVLPLHHAETDRCSTALSLQAWAATLIRKPRQSRTNCFRSKRSRRACATEQGWSRPSDARTDTLHRLRRRPPRRPASSCGRQFPRSCTASASPWAERRACLVTSVRVASYRRVSPENPATLNYSINHARFGSNSCSASTAPLARFDLAAPAGAILTCTRFSSPFAGGKPRVNQLRKSSSAASQFH